jgi:ribosome maturation factor RimP
MLEEETIKKLIEDNLQGTSNFLVNLTLKPHNKIVVLIDNDNGVQVDDCAKLSRDIEAGLDREKEDFEIQVSSPGADYPFKLLRQFKKNLNKEVEVLTEENEKITGLLISANEDEVEIQERQNKKNKNQPRLVKLNYNQIKEIKRTVSLK